VSGFYDVIMDENWDEEVKFKCVEMKWQVLSKGTSVLYSCFGANELEVGFEVM
jgi:hypothetical protein